MKKKKEPQGERLFYFTKREEKLIEKAKKDAMEFMKEYGKGQPLCSFVRNKY